MKVHISKTEDLNLTPKEFVILQLRNSLLGIICASVTLVFLFTTAKHEPTLEFLVFFILTQFFVITTFRNEVIFRNLRKKEDRS